MYRTNVKAVEHFLLVPGHVEPCLVVTEVVVVFVVTYGKGASSGFYQSRGILIGTKSSSARD